MWIDVKWKKIKVDDVIRFETVSDSQKGRCKAVVVKDTKHIIKGNTYLLVEGMFTGDEYVWENKKLFKYQRWEHE
jgi:hypothetical protein